jgi:phospholipid/cholesterol/gamma-HCH transport system substrate-binding protein
VVVKHLDGVKQILVIYPYVVEGGFTVVSKSPDTGLYDAHFGMVLTQDPKVCTHGYESTNVRPPQDGSNAPMNMKAHCAEPPSVSNARGAQNAPRVGAAYRPPVASYDPTTGKLSWGGKVDPALASPGTPAPATLGEESWKWLFLVPQRR